MLSKLRDRNTAICIGLWQKVASCGLAIQPGRCLSVTDDTEHSLIYFTYRCVVNANSTHISTYIISMYTKVGTFPLQCFWRRYRHILFFVNIKKFCINLRNANFQTDKLRRPTFYWRNVDDSTVRLCNFEIKEFILLKVWIAFIIMKRQRTILKIKYSLRS